MKPKAINSLGSILAIGTKNPIPEEGPADVYIDLCNVTGFSSSGSTKEEIDVTTLCSEAREFLTGYTDNGTITLNAFWTPGYEGQKRLMELMESGKAANFRETYPDDGVGNGETLVYYKALVQSIGKSAAVGSAVTMSITLRVSGAIKEVLPDVGG